MKKKCLAVGGICAVLAAVLFVIGMYMLGWDFKKLDSSTWEGKTYVLTSEEGESEKIEELSLDLENARLIVNYGGEEFKVEYEESEKTKFDIDFGSGKMRIEEKNERRFLNMFDFHSPTVKIYLPEAGKLDIGSVNGEIDIGGGSYEEVKITTTNGKISLSDIETEKGIKVTTTNGAVWLKNAVLGEDLNIGHVNGKIDLDSVSARTIELKGTNGAVQASSVTAEKFDVTTVNGKITLSAMTVENTKLRSVNGGIDGGFVGEIEDYTIACSTVNGKVTPGNRTGGDKKIECTTTNGSITLRFAEVGKEEEENHD